MAHNVGDGFELVGMHISKEDVVEQVKKLGKRDAKLARFSKPRLNKLPNIKGLKLVGLASIIRLINYLFVFESK